MGLAKDIKLSALKLWDLSQISKRYSRFGHRLRDFPLPEKRPLTDPLPKVAVLSPFKNAAQNLPGFFALINALDFPKDRLHLRLLEGDSTDDGWDIANALIARDGYASSEVIKFDTGFDAGDGRRNRAEIQRHRRASIAACRNRLLLAAMETDADYVLFVDIDMAEIPSNTLRRMLEFRAPILMANCLLQGTTAVFDLNAFRYTRPVSDRMAARYVKGGIYQPPKGYFRSYTDRSQGHEIEPLHSVGGTCLLIRRDVIAAGVLFPEQPHHLHIETEGFAIQASEAGFGSFSAPQICVYHPWET